MDPKRWTTVNRIFHAALELPASLREAFVSTASEGDVELELNVLRLLKADSDAGSYLETPLTAASLGLEVSPSPFEPGEILKNRFRIERHVGQGGMGHVFEAFDLDLKIRVALKVIRPEIASNPAAVEYFRREVRIARTITDVNICRTYDMDRVAVSPGSRDSKELYFLSMEFLDGETLAAHIQRDGPFAQVEAQAIARQIASGLDSAHKVGVIHRDLKPANIMLVSTPKPGTEPRPVIMDFGLARRDPIAVDASAISHGAIVGTLAYMAPEQLDASLPVSAGTDIYAFGLILFEMVTGQRAYPSSNLLSGIAQRLSGLPPDTKALAPDLDDAWARAIEGCLRPEVKDRFQSASEVIEVLDGQTAARSRKTERRANLGHVWHLLWRWRRIIAGGAVALMVVSLFAAWFRLNQQSGNSRVKPGALVLLAPVNNQTGEKALDNLTELLQAGMSQSVQINLLDQGRVGDTLQMMTKPPDTPITELIGREIAMRTGAVRVVFPTIRGTSGAYVLHIDIQQPDNTPVRYRDHWWNDFAWRTSSFPASTGSIAPELSSAIRKASDWIRYEVGESKNDIARLDEPVEDVTSSSWEALEAIARATRYASLGRREDAVSSLQSAIQKDPACAVAYARLGDLQMQMGELGPGVASYLAALDTGVSRRLSRREEDYIRGIYALDTGDYQSAEVSFREYTALYASDYSGWFYRALPLSMLGRFDEADRVLKRAHEVAPEKPGAMGMLVGESLIAGDLASAENWRDRLRSVANSEDSLHFSDAEIAVFRGDLNAAKDAAAALESSSTPAIRAHGARILADLAAEQGDYARAERILTQSIQSYGPQPLLLFDRAHVECINHELGPCLGDIEKAVEGDSSPQMLLRASETLGQIAARESGAARKEVNGHLGGLERRLTERNVGILGEDAKHRLRGEVLLARNEIAGALDEFERSDGLEAPYVGREYLGRAFEAAAQKKKSAAQSCEEVRSAMRAYGVSALHPAFIWELHDQYPPGYYAETLSKWLQLSREEGATSTDSVIALKEWHIFRPGKQIPEWLAEWRPCSAHF